MRGRALILRCYPDEREKEEDTVNGEEEFDPIENVIDAPAPSHKHHRERMQNNMIEVTFPLVAIRLTCARTLLSGGEGFKLGLDVSPFFGQILVSAVTDISRAHSGKTRRR